MLGTVLSTGDANIKQRKACLMETTFWQDETDNKQCKVNKIASQKTMVEEGHIMLGKGVCKFWIKWQVKFSMKKNDF